MKPKMIAAVGNAIAPMSMPPVRCSAISAAGSVKFRYMRRTVYQTKKMHGKAKQAPSTAKMVLLILNVYVLIGVSIYFLKRALSSELHRLDKRLHVI